MTQDEAQVIADVISTVDWGCRVCITRMAKLLIKRLPYVDWKSLAWPVVPDWREVDAWVAGEGDPLN